MSLDRIAAAFSDFCRRLWAWLRRHPWKAAAGVALLPIIYVLAWIPFTPGISDIRKAKAEQPTVVLSADGKELAVFKRANRDWVKLADISPHVQAALIATEDRRFFDHHGFDVRRTIAAAAHTVQGNLQGGSTITQQLARNLYPEEIGRAPTITRKIKEAITAFKIESVYTKNEILETYLNTVPFLYNAYGIEMAARTYFDKSAGELDELQSATLIGMLKGTSHYNPVLNPERSLQRRNTVLAQMAREGKLTQAKLDALKTRPLALDFERQAEDVGMAPHLTQQLRRWLIEWADRRGYNIYADGLVVRTTIDSRLQTMAAEAVTRQADKLQKAAEGAWRRGGWKAHKELAQVFVRETAPYQAAVAGGLADADAVKKVLADAGFMEQLWEDKTRLQAAFLALDPSNGHVKAWIGSRDFDEDKFDHVQQARRQPGSTFKPFVYGAAFEQGISPAETFIDQAVEIRIDERTVWKPGDVGEPSGLPTTLRDGLTYSKNSITSQLMQRVGPSRVAKVAWDMGVRQSKLDQVPSLALGTSPVTLKEMVTAFGSIANGGSYMEPVVVTRIEDRGHRLIEAFGPKPPERALSLHAAETLLDVMRAVIDKGTGAGIRSRFGIQGDVAGKTGTTQSNTDGWFILMHPQLVGGAWVGFNDNRVTMTGDSWGQGAHNALNIVGDFFQQSFKAKRLDARTKFAAPRDQGVLDPLMGKVNDWWQGMFGQPAQPLPEPAVVAEPPPVYAPALPPESAVVAQPGSPPALPPSFQQVPEIQRLPEVVRPPVTLRADRQGQVVIVPREQLEMAPAVPRERPVLRPETGEAGAGPAMPPLMPMPPSQQGDQSPSE
jgi:penicillin-binding protein 1A